MSDPRDPVVAALARALGAKRRGDTAGVRQSVHEALDAGADWGEVAFAFGVTPELARERWASPMTALLTVAVLPWWAASAAGLVLGVAVHWLTGGLR